MSYRLITDQDIEAFVDNALSKEDEKQVVEYLKISPRARAKYQYLYQQKKKIQNWWDNR